MRVLVVEDNLEIREEIEDALFALGYEHDWATSQQEARELLAANHYDCALVDLEIPARPGRGFAKIEHGRQLVDDFDPRRLELELESDARFWGKIAELTGPTDLTDGASSRQFRRRGQQLEKLVAALRAGSR